MNKEINQLIQFLPKVQGSAQVYFSSNMQKVLAKAEKEIADNEKKLKCEYFLEEVWVTKWEVSGLDAMSNNVLIDTFEVEFVNLKKQIF